MRTRKRDYTDYNAEPSSALLIDPQLLGKTSDNISDDSARALLVTNKRTKINYLANQLNVVDADNLGSDCVTIDMKRKDYPTLFGKINVQLAEDKSQTALVLEYQKEGEFSEEKLSKGGLSDRNQDKKRVGTYLSYYSAFD